MLWNNPPAKGEPDPADNNARSLHKMTDSKDIVWLFYFSNILLLFCILSRWRIVVHGGVDGYSRIPVFLKASDNNRAATVLSLFLDAVNEYGLPSRVRSDKGGENVDVSWYMLTIPQRGPGRGSMITGEMTENC